MIDYGRFQFAAPLGTRTGWIMNTCKYAGLKILPSSPGNVFEPFESTYSEKFRLSVVRHPCDWLAVLYQEAWPAASSNPSGKISNLVTRTFDEFIRHYLAMMPDGVTKMFAAYGADVCLRFEDFPWCFHQFLESIGIQVTKTETRLNLTSTPVWNSDLYREVKRANQDFCERYEY